MSDVDSDDDFMMESSDVEDYRFDSDDDGEENFSPSPKKARGGGHNPSSSALALMDKDDNVEPASGKGEKTVEEIYQKKTQVEHILIRPDTYIGTVERDAAKMYIMENGRIVEKEIIFTPGLFKIFDEIVVNAADNKQRDPKMDKLDIDIDVSSNVISVKNNGKGIPVVVHKEHNVYIPTLIFGHLLTGSNFDDDEKKTTGGRNGYGAKLTNIFSTEFIIECVDTEHNVKFRQVFRDNMAIAEDPVVTKCTASEKKQGDYVKITFSPDLNRFGMTHLDDDTVALFSKRAYDIAGTMAARGGKKLVVKLNGEKLPIKSFKDYLGLFDGIQQPVAYEKNDEWEVGVSASTDNTPHQISFVNAICTYKGGTHVSYIADQVGSHLVKVLTKRKKKKPGEVKPAQVKNHLTIFINCLIENPAFDSQTKDHLHSKSRTFGSSIKLSDKFLKQVEKSDIVSTIESYMSFRERQALNRKGGTKKSKLTGITKLDDANFAGTAKSVDCTLIITEGDSAKSLAMSGLSVVGRDYYGVFPLRGKLLNVRDTSDKTIAGNEEIKNLVEILGLKYGVAYDESNIKSLRYGHLMIMADQDTDGSHIKGLVINLIHCKWPTLLDVPGFLQQFITPIVKVSKGKKTRTFFTLPEYEQWLESTGNNGKGYTIKYYKGLGTSTSAEAKEYFSNLDLHQVDFAKLSIDESYPEDYEELDDEDPMKKTTTGSDLIDMVFRKDRVEDRKQWLNASSKDNYMDYAQASAEGGVMYSDFINKEYIQFSRYDNDRSIPSVVDGLKTSQRKVLYGCFKRKLKSEIKVAQLTGYIAEHSAYHHGETSLQGTIVNMAQNFCGSNNVNLLTPSGQFGTRRLGGKDAASPRYIFTRLEPITRAIFHPDDDELLSYRNDDGASIEPEFYVPVIPLVLVNGAEGIGTGWSSNVPNYNPRDVIANLRRKIAGEEVEPMAPYYSGFTGEIIAETGRRKGSYQVMGKIERLNDTTLQISELPVKKWTQDYKQFLEGLMLKDPKNPDIKDFKENHTDTTVSFTITAEKAKIDEFEKGKKGLYGKFKLSGSLSTNNMTLFDTETRIVKYGTPEAILSTFYDVRMDFYVKRKQLLVQKLGEEKCILSNKARFVEEVCAGDLVVNNRKRAELLTDLQERGYDAIRKDNKTNSTDESDEEDDEMELSDAELAKGYEYLLGMKIWSLTFEKAQALRAELAEKTQELADLEATEPSQIWLDDLDAIEDALEQREAQINADLAEEHRAQKKNKKHQAKAKKKTARGRKKRDEWDSDMETSSSEDEPDFDSDNSGGPSFRLPKKTVTNRRKPTASKSGRPPAAAAAAAANASINASSNSSRTVKAAIAKKKSPPKAAPAAKKPAEAEPIDSDSDMDDDLGESLLERMKKKLVVSPPAKKKTTGMKKDGKKRPSPKMDDTEVDSDVSSDDYLAELDADDFVMASVTPAKKKGSKVSQPLKRNKPAEGASTRGPIAKKNQASVDLAKSDSDEFEFKSENDDSSVKKPAAARPRRARVTKTVNYAYSDDEEDEDTESDSD